MTTNIAGLVPVSTDLEEVSDVLAEVAIMSINDVLAACVQAGAAWDHPSWDGTESKMRFCQAKVTLPNEWVVSIGCCDTHYCANRDFDTWTLDIYGESKSPEEWFASPDAEIAIFKPDGSWYIPEGETPHPGNTWVGGWWDAARIWNVITYLSGR